MLERSKALPALRCLLLLTAVVMLTPQAALAAPPTVSITSPTEGSSVKGTIAVTADADAGAGQTMSSIAFFDGVQGIGTVSCQSQIVCTGSIQWHATGLTGPHTLTARATNAASQQTTSAGVTVTVDTPPPSVSVVAPAADATVKGTVQVTAAAATDPALADYPTSIALFDGVNSIGTISCQGQTTCSGDVNWAATGLTGPHSLIARVTTQRSERASSVPVQVNVVTPAPTVRITRPASGTGFSGGSLLISASAATDPALVDYPTSITIFDGKNQIGTIPCQGQKTCAGSIRWVTTGLTGTHMLAAVVRTNRSESATSKRVSVGRRVRRKARVSCQLSKTRIKVGRSARGTCTIPGAPTGTAVSVAYRKGGSLKTFAQARTAANRRFHFSVTGPRGTYRLVVVVHSSTRFLRTTVSVATLRIVR